MTKYQLETMLFSKMDNRTHEFRSTDGKVYVGQLLGITKEDGSGSSFILLINGFNGVKHSFHIRTID